MASIRWENVTKDFGRVIAVKELNLECKDGEFMALLGPSGCGKTTTLRMTAGLETPTSGTIYFDDKPINHLAPRERNIAMVFENYALYPHRTVYKNISYPLEILKLPPKQIDEKVHYAAKLLEIDPLLNRYPKEISGRPEAARRHRARARTRAVGFCDGRAAVAPGRQIARLHARRSSSVCRKTWASPPSLSPTISWKPSRWPIAWQ